MRLAGAVEEVGCFTIEKAVESVEGIRRMDLE